MLTVYVAGLASLLLSLSTRPILAMTAKAYVSLHLPNTRAGLEPYHLDLLLTSMPV